MNAMEDGNRDDPDLPVAIQVRALAELLTVSITDHGGGQEVLDGEAPDLEAKLAGLQSPRWRAALIRSMVDDMNVTLDDVHHTVELVMHLQGDQEASQAV